MAAEPKERPILFSGPMVRKVRANEKTQTRRVMMPQPPAWVERMGVTCFTPTGSISGRGRYNGELAEKFFRCPYGVPGDRLWVRETFAITGACPLHDLDADDPARPCLCNDRNRLLYRADCGDAARRGTRWRPSIHMPRWASRLTLEVTAVRVERLWDIGDQDIIAEGVERNITAEGCADPRTSACTMRSRFARLWDELNAKRGYGWETNPWVRCVGFRRLDDAERCATWDRVLP